MKRAEVAVVDEARCIGCTLCIAACPVDAIVGARGLMHTVVDPWCTGCRLCVPPCPADCIEMHPAADLSATEKAAARTRAKARKARLAPRPSQAPPDRKTIIAAALSRKARA